MHLRHEQKIYYTLLELSLIHVVVLENKMMNFPCLSFADVSSMQALVDHQYHQVRLQTYSSGSING